MSFKFGKASEAQLATVHPDLAKVCRLALQLTSQDFSVFEGVRTLARQKALYAQGRTMPGRVVTWTMNSKHFAHPDGYGHAVDLLNYPVNYNATKQFMAIAWAMKRAAKQLGIPIRWGGDWDEDNIPMEKGETDIGHFELRRA